MPSKKATAVPADAPPPQGDQMPKVGRFEVPSDLHYRLKVMAVHRRTTLRKLIAEILDTGLTALEGNAGKAS